MVMVVHVLLLELLRMGILLVLVVDVLQVVILAGLDVLACKIVIVLMIVVELLNKNLVVILVKDVIPLSQCVKIRSNLNLLSPLKKTAIVKRISVLNL